MAEVFICDRSATWALGRRKFWRGDPTLAIGPPLAIQAQHLREGHLKKPAPDKSLAKKTAQELRRLSLASEPQTFLGSEKDLIERLGVSRPTFRQAAKMVEHEQLISISRGIGGGFYSRRPEISAVLHAASVYLMARKNTLSDLLRATNPLTIELARLAAQCNDPALREELSALYEQTKAAEHVPQSLHEFHAGEGEMMNILYKLGGNPSLELMLRVLYQFGMSAFRTSLFEGHEELMQKRRSARIRLIKAVLDGDQDIAELVTRRNAKEMEPYMTTAVLEQQLDMMPSKP